tara:strand:+ start:3027 stop:3689 length:663 start_codon:yes stop_codon:yes gene_type:complete
MTRTTALAFVAGAAAAAAVLVLPGFGPEDGHDHTGHGHDGHNGTAHQPDTGQSDRDMQKEMEQWMAMASPGENHAVLDKSVGKWTAKTSFIMDPSQPPTEGEGTMTSEWVLGKRFVKSDFYMKDMMGTEFQGLAYTGYDNIKGEYVSTWMDTFGTGILMMTGEHDGSRCVMEGESVSPEGPYTMKIVTTWHDDDHFTDVFYDKVGDDGWRKSGEIKYTRN